MLTKHDESGVRKERSGWRDEEISNRHRLWGFNCPCVDLDFLVAEYNVGLPVALIEYKHFKAGVPNLKHPTYRALSALCDGYNNKPLPFFVARYWPEFWAFKVTPVNAASQYLVKREILSEADYVKGLYILRRLVIEEQVLKKLNTIIPDM